MENSVLEKKEKLRHSLNNAVKEYLENEEAYSDNVQLEINTATLEVALADPDQDLPGCDYYQVMDLVKASTDNPGSWEVDEDAVSSVVAEYLTA